MAALAGIAPLAHGGMVGLLVEVSGAIGLFALAAAAWVGAHKDRR